MTDLDDMIRAYEAGKAVWPYRECDVRGAIESEPARAVLRLDAVIDWLDSRDTDPAPAPCATVLPDDDGGLE